MEDTEERDTWESLGRESFDATVDFFAQFLVNPDRKELQKWVKEFALPDDCYGIDMYEFLENDYFMDVPFVSCSDAIHYFKNKFEINPDGDWSVMEGFITSFYDWDLDDIDANVKFDLESGSVVSRTLRLIGRGV